MTAHAKCIVEQRRLLTKPTLPIGWHWFTLLAVQAYCTIWALNYPRKHQLHHLGLRTSCSDIIMSLQKTSVLVKLSNVTSAEFFTSTANILCW